MRLRDACRELAGADFLEDRRPAESLFGVGATIGVDGQAREKGAPVGFKRLQIAAVGGLEVTRRPVERAQFFRAIRFEKIAQEGSEDRVRTRARFKGKAAAE